MEYNSTEKLFYGVKLNLLIKPTAEKPSPPFQAYRLIVVYNVIFYVTYSCLSLKLISINYHFILLILKPGILMISMISLCNKLSTIYNKAPQGQVLNKRCFCVWFWTTILTRNSLSNAYVSVNHDIFGLDDLSHIWHRTII